MNRPIASILTRKRNLVALILLAAFAMGIPQQRRLSQARAAAANARMQQAALDQRIAEATTALASAREELRSQRASRSQTLAAALQAERDLFQADPEGRWSIPPANEPEWQSGSPYVWLRKDLLPQLPVEVFAKNGDLRPDVASVLCVDGSTQRALNDKLEHLLADYHALEAAGAERSENHLTGISDDGPRVTVQIKSLAKEGAALKRQFQDALLDALGQQRTELLTRADCWFDSHGNEFASEPKTISVVRHPNGTYNIAIKSANGWSSSGGVKNLDGQVPSHLLPLFSDVLEQPAPAVSSPPGQ